LLAKIVHAGAVKLRRLIRFAVLLAGIFALVTGVIWELSSNSLHPEVRTDEATQVVSTQRARALKILRTWDQRRAEAWVHGDVAELKSLYSVGSRTGMADQAMLRSYVKRGLVVDKMNTQVLSAEVRLITEQRIVLVVTDRLATAIAQGKGFSRALPSDQPTSHMIELVHGSGSWLVREVH
jgi:hypothetical protein